MNPQPDDPRPTSFERPAFLVLCVCLTAPVLAHGLWRPLLHIFGPSGGAGAITLAALAISGAMGAARALRPGLAPLPLLALGAGIAVPATLGLSLGRPGLLTLLAVVAAVFLLLQRLPAGLPTTLDGLARRHKILFALYALLALAAVVKTAQLSVYIGDPSRPDMQAVPGEKFIETHSCLTAYVHADALSRGRLANLYDERNWQGAHGLAPAAPGVGNPYHPFLLDYYAYPPPFLLAMLPLAPFAGDFAAQRALWFGLNGLLLAVGLWLVAGWLDGPGRHRVLLLAPIFFGSLPVLATLQIGNFQIAVVMLSVLAMVAFDRDRPLLGGALLAFAILSKLSPGVFGIVLLAQRRPRAAAWTAGAGVVLLALSLLLLGLQPMQSFLTYTLPRISSGETFAFLDDTVFNVLTNMGAFGLPFKLQLLGVPIRDPWISARLLSRIFTVIILALAAFALRRSNDRRTQAISWMSLLVLGALQSPFAPAYVTIGLLWAITLLVPDVRRFHHGFALALLWFLITYFPSGAGLQLKTVYATLQSVLTLGVPIWLILRKIRFPRDIFRPSAGGPDG